MDGYQRVQQPWRLLYRCNHSAASGDDTGAAAIGCGMAGRHVSVSGRGFFVDFAGFFCGWGGATSSSWCARAFRIRNALRFLAARSHVCFLFAMLDSP
jgi:hypothetical protein